MPFLSPFIDLPIVIQTTQYESSAVLIKYSILRVSTLFSFFETCLSKLFIFSQLEGKIGELRQQYRSKLEQLRTKNEAQTQSSVSEVEEMYRLQMEELKQNQEKMVQEHVNQVEQFRKQVLAMSCN